MKDDLLPAVAAMKKFDLMAGRSNLWIAPVRQGAFE
jgi:hypothetical protein